MIRVSFIAIALFCAYPSVAFSYTNNTCQNIFGKGWELSYDTEAFQEAERFISKLNESYVPFVCVGRDDLHSPARTVRGGNGPPWTLLIAIDNRFLHEGRKTLRGLMAHEIAHYALPEGLACEGLWLIENHGEYHQCESAVDMLAARWTSSKEVARALRAVAYFLPEDSDPRAIAILDERIHVLEYAQ